MPTPKPTLYKGYKIVYKNIGTGFDFGWFTYESKLSHKTIEEDTLKSAKESINREIEFIKKNYKIPTKKPAAKKPAAKKPAVKKPAIKKPAVKKDLLRQTGKTNKLYDLRKQAFPPGKRITKYGTVTYERRENRTDKGKLMGVSRICGLPKFKDEAMAREIELYAENDNDLYRQQRRPILINLSKKHQKGTYNITAAAKLWRYFIDAALKKYNKEFGSRYSNWYDLMSTGDRQLLAEKWAQETKDEFDLGNYTN